MEEERWDAFLEYPRFCTPRASHRKPEPLPATLGLARRHHLYLVAWCRGCKDMLCVPLAPLIIRWGSNAALEPLARAFRCSRCGRRGMAVAEPGWAGGFRRCLPERGRWTGRQDWHPALGAFSLDTMCNLYSQTKDRNALKAYFRVGDNRCAELKPQAAIFPKTVAPVVRLASDGERELVPMMWGFPLLRKGYAPKPVTNVRDDTVLTSPFWRPSFEARRCLVPASSYCEPDDKSPAGWHWFALTPSAERPLFCFPGIWRRHQGPVKKDGPTIEIDVYAFMTTKPNALTGTIMHDRMPVLLSEPEEFETWLSGPPDAAFKLVRTFEAERMRIVQSGPEKMDRLGEAV